MLGRLKYWLCMLFYMSTHHNLQIVTFEWKLQLSYNTVDVTCCKQMRYFSGFIVSFSGYWQSRCSITLTDARTFLVIHEDGLSFKLPRASAPNSQATCPVILWSQTSTRLLSYPSCLDDIFVQYKVAFSTLKICYLVKPPSSVICISEIICCSFSSNACTLILHVDVTEMAYSFNPIYQFLLLAFVLELPSPSDSS